MSIRYGVSPIAWINDDMPELGGETPVEKVLQEAHDIGFAGVELGGKFPRQPDELRTLLGRYFLELIGGWYSGSLLSRTADEEIEALRPHLSLLQSLESEVFVIAETSNAIHGQRTVPLRQSPQLNDEQWRAFGARLTTVADFIQSQGLRFAYHHHLGTVVESQDELDRFLTSTGDSVGLTLDSGHAALGGIDALHVVRTAPGRVAHVHCKDVRRQVFERVLGQSESFLDGVLEGMFTVPGDGDLDFSELMRALRDIGYSGWIVIEAEQDPAIANPRDYATVGLRTLRSEARAAGLLEVA